MCIGFTCCSSVGHFCDAYVFGILMQSIHDDESRAITGMNDSHYYLLPSFFLFDRSSTLLNMFLTSMKTVIDKSSSPCRPHHASSKINRANWNAIVSVLLLMHEDIKMRQILLPHKSQVERVIQSVLILKV